MQKLNTDKAAENFMKLLVSENYWAYSDDDLAETFDELKEDFRLSYEVAPRLINLLNDISDR